MISQVLNVHYFGATICQCSQGDSYEVDTTSSFVHSPSGAPHKPCPDTDAQTTTQYDSQKCCQEQRSRHSTVVRPLGASVPHPRRACYSGALRAGRGRVRPCATAPICWGRRVS